MSVLRTVTLNTGYDDYYTVSGLDWGGVGSMHAYRSVCSGKGISCARAARALGLDTVAYGLIGRGDEPDFTARLEAEGLAHAMAPVPGRARHNLSLIDGEGERVAAHFVAAGYTLDEEDIAPLTERLLGDIVPGDLVTLNGSLPGGLPASTWADLALAARARGAEVIIDAQKLALTAALGVGGLLAFKPNETEVLAIPAVADAPEAERLRVALRLFERAGATLPLVSLGADGVAVLIDDEALHGSCPVERPVQSVMAGDTFVAGLAWGRLASADRRDWVRHALAAAAAHVAGNEGADLLPAARDNLARVRFEPLP